MFRKIALCIVLALLAHASRVAAGDKNGAGRMLVLRATEQSISAGTPGAVQSKYQFVVVWKSADPPVNFMWRGKNELVACKVQRAHRNTMVNPGTPSPEYMTSFIAPGSKITKDDTLLHWRAAAQCMALCHRQGVRTHFISQPAPTSGTTVR